MELIRGFYKRYFPNQYYKKYIEAQKPTIDYHSQQETDKYYRLVDNAYKVNVMDNGNVEETFHLVYKPYNVNIIWRSEKYIKKLFINDVRVLALVENFEDNKGNRYEMTTNTKGEIYSIQYSINGKENEIDFISNNGRVTVFDNYGFERNYSSYKVFKVYECDEFLKKVKSVRVDHHGQYKKGYSIFTDFSNKF